MLIQILYFHFIFIIINLITYKCTLTLHEESFLVTSKTETQSNIFNLTLKLIMKHLEQFKALLEVLHLVRVEG